MAIFDVNALDAGIVNAVPTGAPAQVITTAANTTTFTGANRFIAGAMEDLEYVVVSPALQVDGTTAASGSYVLAINFYQDDGTTLVDTNTFPSQAAAATVNGASVGTEVPYRVALPYGATRAKVVLTVTGAVGQMTAGWALGGHTKNRAG